MSNFLAVATVTAAFNQSLQAAVGQDVPGASVTTVRPDALGNGNRPDAGVNIYLYQVTPNPGWRNADLPTRGNGGELMQRPRTALDLHYLLSFYGDENRLEPQRLLGSVVRILHARPLLTRQLIRDTVANPAFHFLEESDLAEEVELVKFSPTPLNLEELSKLWSVFFQTPYTLSAAYQGTVVLIESEDVPQAALPVRERRIYMAQFRQPVIEQVMALQGPHHPIAMGGTLLIRGRGLQAEMVQVRIGGVDILPQEVTDTRITVPLTDAALRPGVLGVQVVHPIMVGNPSPAPHGVESNAAAFVLRPVLRSIQIAALQNRGGGSGGIGLTVQFEGTIGQNQRVVLLIAESSGAGTASYTFTAPPRDEDSNTVTIPLSGITAGDYLVRVRVDGAESPLEVDTDPASPTFNRYVGPSITVGNFLRAAKIELKASKRRRGDPITGQVFITDQEGNPVQGATVSVTWRRPEGRPQQQTGTTDRRGVAREFATGDDDGRYTLTVTGINKENYSFDPDNSVLEKSITWDD